MKHVIQQLIRLRNPNFSFDREVRGGLLFSFFANFSLQLLRGLRLLIYGRYAKGIALGKGVQFFYLSNMKLGEFVKIGDHTTLNATGRGKLVIGRNSGIGAFSRVVISTSFNNLGSHIYIGENVGIGEFAYLGGGGGLEIGNDCIVGQYFSCHPENHNYEDPKQLIREQGVSRKGIIIGSNCWIGAKVTILDGVIIGSNCVIAAGAVVTKSMPSNSVIGGVPARVIKSTHEIQVSQMQVVAS